MFVPEAYGVALVMMIYTMLCWGSWVNLHRICSGWRFELFYWDYIWGILLCSILVGITLGRTDPSSPDSFFVNLTSASGTAILCALASGTIWNLGNVLVVASISLAGMAVALPVGIGLAIIIGSVLNYVLKPMGNPPLLFGGIALMCAAVVLDGLAYRMRSRSAAVSMKGVALAAAGGILMGLFYPLIVKGTTGEGHLGPYTVAFIFAAGAAISNLLFNYVFMRRPVSGPPLAFRDYFAGNRKVHVLGILAGILWQSGAVSNYVASFANIVGPAVSYSIGQAASIVGASWGIFVWKEFEGAPHKVTRYLVIMFVCFTAGLISIALAPVVK